MQKKPLPTPRPRSYFTRSGNGLLAKNGRAILAGLLRALNFFFFFFFFCRPQGRNATTIDGHSIKAARESRAALSRKIISRVHVSYLRADNRPLGLRMNPLSSSSEKEIFCVFKRDPRIRHGMGPWAIGVRTEALRKIRQWL